MYKENRSHKEQVLRNKRITNSENALKKLYMDLLYNEREGTIKQEVFNIFKDEVDIIDIINSEKQWAVE
ncbi:hypothetical protein J2Z44_002823 [Clostridium punense]|uniref:Uncharacterized protein n=1 Tax=Clostridium punense TaxID=1054297 RepID=A0ABS4K5F9_9CLOT|nr:MULTISPECIES: hypothetical protein [Clostridium]EQB89021.1 hypothetical protein M918_22250 [Clostridium sp. BL8]MBP2022998.1 hypothetical protein [Clostridium punense]